MDRQANRLQLRRARAAKKVKAANAPPTRDPSSCTKQEFLAALPGTAGIKTRIAEKLGVDRATIHRLLLRPDWKDVASAFLDEIERGIDAAEQTIYDLVAQREDLAVAGTTAKWLLARRREGYADESTINVRGTIGHYHYLNTPVPAAELNLPREILWQVLQAAEAYAKRQAEAQLVEGRLLPSPPQDNGESLTEAEA